MTVVLWEPNGTANLRLEHFGVNTCVTFIIHTLGQWDVLDDVPTKKFLSGLDLVQISTPNEINVPQKIMFLKQYDDFN